MNLNSWKEIAEYFDRGVRTVQRWEHELGLPVHRIGKGPRSPVYALAAELNFWLGTSGALRDRKRLQAPPRKQTQDKPSTYESRRRLLADVHALAQSIAENSARQRKHAEDLKARILQMRARITR